MCQWSCRRYVQLSPLLALFVPCLFVAVCDGARHDRAEGGLQAGLGDRCAAVSSCPECTRILPIGVCTYDLFTNKCCKPKLGGGGGGTVRRMVGQTVTSCESSWTTSLSTQCTEVNEKANIVALANAMLGSDASDFNSCAEDLSMAGVSPAISGQKDLDPGACVSAMLRHAIILDLSHTGLAEEVAEQTCPLLEASPLDSIEARARAPVCCLLRMDRVFGDLGQQCKLSIIPDGGGGWEPQIPASRGFRMYRNLVPNANENLLASMKASRLEMAKFTAGHSTSSFLRTGDSKFFLKTMRMDSQNEPRNLLKLHAAHKGRPDIVTYSHRNNGLTILNPMLGLYRVQYLQTDQVYAVMEDAALGLRQGDDCVVTTYDLKGASRAELPVERADESKSEHENVEFKRYRDNKFHLTPEDCKRLVDSVEQDAKFLAVHNMIDYSIFARFGRGTACSTPVCDGRANCFTTTLGERLTISIIDYLNKYTASKRAEGMLPTRMGKFSNYGLTIVNFVRGACDMLPAESL